MQLRRKRVYSIDQKVYLIVPKNITGLFRFKILLDDHEVQFRIYILQTVSENVALRLSYRRVQCQKLPVLVCHRNVITVQDYKMPHTGTDNHFSGISAYATDSNHCHGGIPEMLQHLLPYQHRRPFLPIVYHNPFAFPSSQIASISASVISVRLRP